VLDDLSRFVAPRPLCSTMKGRDVTETLGLALAASEPDQVKVRRRPRLLSDNGSSYIAGDLAERFEDQGLTRIRGAPRHPQTQGSERGVAPVEPREPHERALAPDAEEQDLLEHYYLPSALEEQVAAFVEHYNHARPHKSLVSLTPADVYLGPGEAIQAERERIKQHTLAHRRLQHHARAA
jgi:transposase InsO family protein